MDSSCATLCVVLVLLLFCVYIWVCVCIHTYTYFNPCDEVMNTYMNTYMGSSCAKLCVVPVLWPLGVYMCVCVHIYIYVSKSMQWGLTYVYVWVAAVQHDGLCLCCGPSVYAHVCVYTYTYTYLNICNVALHIWMSSSCATLCVVLVLLPFCVYTHVSVNIYTCKCKYIHI